MFKSFSLVMYSRVHVLMYCSLIRQLLCNWLKSLRLAKWNRIEWEHKKWKMEEKWSPVSPTNDLSSHSNRTCETRSTRAVLLLLRYWKGRSCSSGGHFQSRTAENSGEYSRKREREIHVRNDSTALSDHSRNGRHDEFEHQAGAVKEDSGSSVGVRVVCFGFSNTAYVTSYLSLSSVYCRSLHPKPSTSSRPRDLSTEEWTLFDIEFCEQMIILF